MTNNTTFDNKRQIKPLRLENIDEAFYKWWNEKLALHLTTDDGSKRKVPVHFVAPERWALAREEGIRDRHGTIILPIVAISRTKVGGPNEVPYNRIVADIKRDHVYSRRVHPKSSLIKELIKNRGSDGREGWTLDPSLPIYEIYTSRVADHMVLQYEVAIWTQYIEQMNEIIEKVGQEYDFLSVKSFKFETDDGFYFVGFQDDDMTDESNMDDYTDSERLIRRNYVFNVPGYIIPESNDKKSSFKRYLSQTKIVFKETYTATQDELDELLELEKKEW